MPAGVLDREIRHRTDQHEARTVDAHEGSTRDAPTTRISFFSARVLATTASRWQLVEMIAAQSSKATIDAKTRSGCGVVSGGAI